MTRCLLIRHGAHDYLGRGIPGRLPGVHLNDFGRRQAEQLATQLAPLPIDAIYSSPMERSCETAEPLAQRLQLQVQIADEFTELEMGEWTDRTFVELEDTPRWNAFNHFRSCVAAPGGELMSDAQSRMVRKILQLRDQHRCVAIFSHGDPIRAALCHFLGLHLDMFARLEVDPAGISLVELEENFARVRWVSVPCSSALLFLPH